MDPNDEGCLNIPSDANSNESKTGSQQKLKERLEKVANFADFLISTSSAKTHIL